jgi:hypothetical protein
VAFTITDVGHGLFGPQLLLLLVLQHHHQLRPWVSLTPLPLPYHLLHIFSWFSLCSFQILFYFFPLSGENKKILLQSGKGFPKSMWWKIGATLLISFLEGGEMFAILQYFWGRLRRTCFPAKFCLFYERRKRKGKKSILGHQKCACCSWRNIYMRSVKKISWKFLQFF